MNHIRSVERSCCSAICRGLRFLHAASGNDDSDEDEGDDRETGNGHRKSWYLPVYHCFVIIYGYIFLISRHMANIYFSRRDRTVANSGNWRLDSTIKNSMKTKLFWGVLLHHLFCRVRDPQVSEDRHQELPCQVLSLRAPK